MRDAGTRLFDGSRDVVGEIAAGLTRLGDQPLLFRLGPEPGRVWSAEEAREVARDAWTLAGLACLRVGCGTDRVLVSVRREPGMRAGGRLAGLGFGVMEET